jgi:hypothetical protein
MNAAARAARAAATPAKLKRWWVPNPTGKGLDPSYQGQYNPKKPPKDYAANFRDCLLRAARPNMQAIADRIVEKAIVDSDMTALKYVADQLLEMSSADETPLARALRRLADARDAERGESPPEMDDLLSVEEDVPEPPAGSLPRS